MLIKVNPTSEVPIYMQIRKQIISGIASGDLTAGEHLPPVRQLAFDIGINMHTVNKAYNILKSEGYVNINGRRGVTIAERTKAEDSDISTIGIMIEEIIDEARAKGISDKDFMEMVKGKILEGGLPK